MSLFVASSPQTGPAVRWRSLASHVPWRDMLEVAALYLMTLAFGFSALVGLFRAGALGGEMLFYRGLTLIALAFPATLAAGALAIGAWSRSGLRLRDAFAAAVMSTALNLSFFIVLPVTVDRSISVFILGEMTAHTGRAYSSEDMSRLFSKVYVGDYRQIDRRMHEQLLSGNLEPSGRGYRISARGAHFIQLSKAIAWMFDSDTRFVSPPHR
jgi:hypothetical protein